MCLFPIFGNDLPGVSSQLFLKRNRLLSFWLVVCVPEYFRMMLWSVPMYCSLPPGPKMLHLFSPLRSPSLKLWRLPQAPSKGVPLDTVYHLSMSRSHLARRRTSDRHSGHPLNVIAWGERILAGQRLRRKAFIPEQLRTDWPQNVVVYRDASANGTCQ